MIISDTITTIANSTLRIFKSIPSYLGGDKNRPKTVPGPPIAVEAVATVNGHFGRVSFGKPTYDGGSPITSYTVKSIPGGIIATKTGPDGGSITVSGLCVGTTYTFSVIATNAIGNSTETITLPITTTGVPSEPISVTAEAISSTSIRLRFNNPTSTGGRNITGYSVISYPDGKINTIQGEQSDIIISGLVCGSFHSFCVSAVNGNGVGAKSKLSNMVSPGINFSEHTTAAISYMLKGKTTGPWNKRLKYDNYDFEFYATTGAQSMFSVLDYPNTMTRNQNFWGKDLDLTGIGAFNCTYPPTPTNTSNTYPGYPNYGSLISRRHVIFASHAPLGDSISFVKKDGTILPYRILKWSSIIEGSLDIKIGIFAEDVSSDLAIYKVLPSGYRSKLSLPFSAIGTNQFKEAIVLQSSEYGHYNMLPTDSEMVNFSIPIITGDSGSPVFTVAENNELILLNCWHHGGPTPDGPFIADFKPAINSAMSELSKALNLSSDYQLIEVDLCKYPNV